MTTNFTNLEGGGILDKFIFIGQFKFISGKNTSIEDTKKFLEKIEQKEKYQNYIKLLKGVKIYNFLDQTEDFYLDNIHCWKSFHRGSRKQILKRPIIIYFLPNAGNLTGMCVDLAYLYNLGYHIVCFEYPKYGMSKGPLNENRIVEIGHKLIKNIKNYPNKGIVFLARSLGGIFALHIANQNPEIKVILVGTPYNIRRVIKEKSGINFKRFKKEFRSDLSAIDFCSKGGQLLIYHSSKDLMIKYQHGLNYQSICPNCQLVDYKGGHMEPLCNIPNIQQQLSKFIKSKKSLKRKKKTIHLKRKTRKYTKKVILNLGIVQYVKKIKKTKKKSNST